MSTKQTAPPPIAALTQPKGDDDVAELMRDIDDALAAEDAALGFEQTAIVLRRCKAALSLPRQSEAAIACWRYANDGGPWVDAKEEGPPPAEHIAEGVPIDYAYTTPKPAQADTTAGVDVDPAVNSDHKLVPIEPTEAMWSGLARDIVMWWCMDRPTGAALYHHLKNAGRDIPAWLYDEIDDIDHVPAKGDVAVAIWRAMMENVK